MLREPLGLVRTRIELGAGRVAAQAAAALCLLFAFIFAAAGAALWLTRIDSPMAALFAVAGSFVLVAIVALVALLVISLRQRRVRRESNVTGALTAALMAQPAVFRSGLRLFGAVRRVPLLALGGALVAGILLTSLGSGGQDDRTG